VPDVRQSGIPVGGALRFTGCPASFTRIVVVEAGITYVVVMIEVMTSVSVLLTTVRVVVVVLQKNISRRRQLKDSAGFYVAAVTVATVVVNGDKPPQYALTPTLELKKHR
jgi:hypothetical protein